MPFSKESDRWQQAIYYFTGYEAPKIDTLFEEWFGNDDIPLMKVQLTKQKSVTYVDVDDLQWRVDNAGRNISNTDFVIPFYKTGDEEESGEEASGDEVTYYKARFTLLGNHNIEDRPSGGVYEGGKNKARYDNDFKKSDEGTEWDTGPHTQYAYGTGRALEALLDNDGGTTGFEWNGISVPPERVVDLASFDRAATAFDRVALFYTYRQAELEEWHKRVGMQENEAWKGTAAGVFWHLIHMLNKRYEDYADDLRNGALFSVPGDAIRIAGDVFKKAARGLQQDWATWEAKDGNPLSFLSDLLSKITDHVWDHNITNITYKVHTRARGETKTTYHATGNFRQDAVDEKGHNYGPLNSLDTWKAVGQAAIERWKKSVEENLVDNADFALRTVHDAWSPSVFDLGTIKTSSGDSLSQEYDDDVADKEKKEAEQKEKDQEKKEKEWEEKQEKYRQEQEEKEEKYRKEQEEKEEKYRKEQEEKEEKYRKEQEEKEKEWEEKQAEAEAEQERKEKEAEAKQEKYMQEQEAKQEQKEKEQEQKEKEAEAKAAAKEKEQEQKQAEAEAEQEQKEKEQEAEQEQKEKEQEQKQAEQEAKQEQQQQEQEQKQAEQEAKQEQKEKEAEAKQEEQQKKQEEYQQQQQQFQINQMTQQKAEQERAKKEQEQKEAEQEAKQEQKEKEQEQKQAEAEKEAEQKQAEQEAKQEQKEKEQEQKQAEAEKEAEQKQAEQEAKQEQQQQEQ
ncbi:AAWKG family protein, partial [Streptomyces milbemycinicus]|uniref:AAWKG family protein n=1 Tax=Streptomyces milbemycinicus TaxID=476552 RepID=UPI001475E0E9